MKLVCFLAEGVVLPDCVLKATSKRPEKLNNKIVINSCGLFARIKTDVSSPDRAQLF
jgi:hypothetical protein